MTQNKKPKKIMGYKVTKATVKTWAPHKIDKQTDKKIPGINEIKISRFLSTRT